jgi:hypothetical protein
VWSVVAAKVGSLPWSAVSSTTSPPQAPLERAEVAVEGLERARIAARVRAVAEEHVEVDQVAEHEAARRRPWPPPATRAHAVRVALRVDRRRHAAAGEDVPDLADADTGTPAAAGDRAWWAPAAGSE